MVIYTIKERIQIGAESFSFEGARKYFEDTQLLLIVAYLIYKDASVLVELGIILKKRMFTLSLKKVL